MNPELLLDGVIILDSRKSKAHILYSLQDLEIEKPSTNHLDERKGKNLFRVIDLFKINAKSSMLDATSRLSVSSPNAVSDRNIPLSRPPGGRAAAQLRWGESAGRLPEARACPGRRDACSLRHRRARRPV